PSLYVGKTQRSPIETRRVRRDTGRSGGQEGTLRGRDGWSDGGLLARKAGFQGDNIEGGGDRVRVTGWRLPRVRDSQCRPRDDEDGAAEDGEGLPRECGEGGRGDSREPKRGRDPC